MGARWPQAQVFGQQQRDRALTSPFAASSSPFARIPTPRLGSSLPLRKSVRPHALPLRAAPPPPPPRPVLKNPHLTPAFRASPCHHPLCLPVSYVPAHEAPSAIHLCPPLPHAVHPPWHGTPGQDPLPPPQGPAPGGRCRHSAFGARVGSEGQACPQGRSWDLDLQTWTLGSNGALVCLLGTVGGAYPPASRCPHL